MSRYPATSHVYDLKDDPCKNLGQLISHVRREILSALDAELASDGRLANLELSATQFVVIAALATAESGRSVSISALCKRVSYDAGSMTRMLDRLESKGLICRLRCSADRRSIYIELTEQGRAAFPRMREILMGVLNRLVHGFTKAEVRHLEGYLARMLQNAKTMQDVARRESLVVPSDTNGTVGNS